MTAPTFAHAHDGSIVAAGTEIRVFAGTITKNFRPQDKTSVGDGQAARFDQARWFYQLSVQGWLYADGAFKKAMRTSSINDPATGLLIDRISRASVIRDMLLDDATAAPDPNGVAYWIAAKKTFWGFAGGYAQDTETPLEQTSSNAGLITGMTLYLGDDPLTGPAVLDSIAPNPNFRKGGGIWHQFRYRFSTLPSAIPPIFVDSFEATIKLDNGRQAVGTVMPQRIQVDLNWQGGANIPVSISGPFHGEVVWSDEA